MRRRRFLALGGGLAAGGLAGCAGGSTTPAGEDATTADTGGSGGGSASGSTASGDGKPDGVYVQSFRERMSMQGMASGGPYRFALMFTVPHTFWTVTGNQVSQVPKEEGDAVHLMATVWDERSGTVVPETGLSVELTREGELVSQETIYPMLSQPMSFHYGGNFGLDGDGTYTATLSVGGTNTRLAGPFRDRLTEPATAELDLAFTEASRAEVSSRPLEQGGQPGALRPMEMMAAPQAVAPAREQLPGTVRGETVVDDARFVVTTLDSPPAGVDGTGPYLAVSARTRYNDYVLPAMGLSGTVTSGGETAFDGRLRRTLDPELGYHYGATVEGVERGDELTLDVTTPPQVARHEGYETAFLTFEPATVTL
jgi:hypothetical protein